MPTGLIWRASSWRVPRLVQKVGFAWSTTRAPCVSGIGIALTAFIGTETDSDMSTSGSRRVRKAVPPRGLNCTTWPSTQSWLIRST